MNTTTSDYDETDDSHVDDDASLSSSTSRSNSSSSTNTSLDDFNYNSLIEKAQDKTAEKLNHIAERAAELVDQYTVHNTEEFLTDPLKVYDEVDQVCDEMKGAWEQYRSNLDDIQKDKEAYEQKVDSKFRKVYMHLTTETFADELDDLRHGRVSTNILTSKAMRKEKKQKSENESDILMQENIVIPVQSNTEEDVNVDVKVLVDMLESGMDGWDAIEKELFLQDCENKSRKHQDKETDQQTTMTPHEKRRREIFGEYVK